MPYTITFGFGMIFTARIPPKAMKYLKTKRDDEVAAFGLTPSFMQVPDTMTAADARRAGVVVPEHWGDTNVIYPIIDNIAFYLTPRFSASMAASFAMKGVNLRTGREEGNCLVDVPCQSWWAQQPPWIDGYRAGHQKAVKQFLPLKGENEMALDVARFVGVRPDNPLIDAITASFYLPRDLRKLRQQERGYLYAAGYEALESMSLSKDATRGRSAGPEEVGMGAGANMLQDHKDDPTVSVVDYMSTPFVTVESRIVWLDWWNVAAREIGIDLITVKQVQELESMQRKYESRLWRNLDIRAETDVDSFPSAY